MALIAEADLRTRNLNYSENANMFNLDQKSIKLSLKNLPALKSNKYDRKNRPTSGKSDGKLLR